jgi:anti-sigma factor RsiW
MTDRDHERALDLIIRRGVEDIHSPELTWLDSHLAACPECAAYANDFDSVGQLLQSVAITASAGLVAATQARVHDRAMQLQEEQSRKVLIAVSFCIGALSSTLSGWLWWKFGGWLAARVGMSTAIVGPGVFIAWILPALVIALVMVASARQPIDRTLTLELLGEEQEGGLR